MDFYPRSYILPGGYGDFKADFAASKEIWIWKPQASARGIGIKVVTKMDQVSKTKPGIVQAYLSSPLLIDGYKFDIRVYAVATSFNPLKLYIFSNGLVRFSTKRYCKVKRNSKDRSRFMHLTNYSVNKKSADFEARVDADMEACTGSKWSLLALWKHLREVRGMTTAEVDKVWSDMKEVVSKTFISAEGHFNMQMGLLSLKRHNCFEIWGVDILLDAKLKPWLVEVNTCPDLSASSPLDRAIKGALFSDTFSLVGVPVCSHNPNRHEKVEKAMQGQQGPGGAARRGESAKGTRLKKPAPPPDKFEWYDDLTAADVTMMRESEDEFRRQESTRFQRLFPPVEPGAQDRLSALFETSRASNRILLQWVRCRDNIPPRLQDLLDMKPAEREAARRGAPPRERPDAQGTPDTLVRGGSHPQLLRSVSAAGVAGVSRGKDGEKGRSSSAAARRSLVPP
ncbi:tubulin-tyrosine ligase family-domain-containing protein [Baffinella frigidus]|nr:tubulin-tyrosine ligase family-domain-containing protein [Cryptophyta sp. CCMP2293]